MSLADFSVRRRVTVLMATATMVLFGLIVLLRDADWMDGRVFGMTILAVTLAWVAGSLVATQRTTRSATCTGPSGCGRRWNLATTLRCSPP